MRRILIDNRIITIADNYASEVKGVNKYGKLYLHPDKCLKKIINDLKTKNVSEQGSNKISKLKPLKDKERFIRYARWVLFYYQHDLLTLKPSEMEKLKQKFDMVLPEERLKAKLEIGKQTIKPFYEIIVNCLQYSLVRTYVIAKYIRQIGIKSCVYCNANYTITEEKGQAFYDIDHWMPKSRYPFLAISFYNLQPACHTCNMLKNDDEKHEYLGLYEECKDKNLDVFKFEISHSNITEYITNGRMNNLRIGILPTIKEYRKLVKDMDKKLHLTEIYSEHKDIAEEIIRRKQIFNQSYLDSLGPIFSSSKYDINEKDIVRFIMGMYVEKDDIHKRPLNKMMLDIYESL